MKRFLHPLRAGNIGNDAGNYEAVPPDLRGMDLKMEVNRSDEEPSHENSVDRRYLNRKRSKNFSVHDKDLALRLLHEYDPNDVLASLKWKPEIRAEKDAIITTIHNEFILEADRKEVSQMQVSWEKLHDYAHKKFLFMLLLFAAKKITYPFETKEKAR